MQAFPEQPPTESAYGLAGYLRDLLEVSLPEG